MVTPRKAPSPVAQTPQWQEDRLLVNAAAAGDRPAQERLIGRLAQRFYRIASSMFRGREGVDDVAQGSLLEVLRSAHTFRGESSLETWADRVAVRHVMHAIRAQQEDNAAWDAVDPDDLPHPEPAPLTWEELPGGLGRYLDALTEPLRTTLLLRHAFGYSLQEIAEHTGVPVRRVRKRLLRAKLLFRKMARKDQVVGKRIKRGET